MTRFEMDYPPSVNAYWRAVGGRVIVSREGRAYRDRAGWRALEQRVKPLAGPLRVSICVYRPRMIGDLDNTAKAILDALKGVAWADDSQIVELHLYRRDDKSRPRVVIEMEIMPPIPAMGQTAPNA